MTVWQFNRVLNALALLATALLMVGIVTGFVNSVVQPSADPHGYVRIFSVFLGVLLVIPLLLLTFAALELRRHRRSGFGFQLAAGVTVGLFGAAGGWIGIAVGVLIAMPALAGLVTTPPPWAAYLPGGVRQPGLRSQRKNR
jgi:hypothetical protein